jgi:hypothetical protein
VKAERAEPARGVDDGRASGPAIGRMTPEERAIFVRMLASIALARALDDQDAEDRAASEEAS